MLVESNQICVATQHKKYNGRNPDAEHIISFLSAARAKKMRAALRRHKHISPILTQQQRSLPAGRVIYCPAELSPLVVG